MAQFKYKAKTTSGSITEGTIEAPDVRNASDKLRQQKLIVQELNEVKTGGLGAKIAAMLPFGKGVSSADLTLFSRQLSTLVSSGVPLVQGLTILEDQIEAPAFKKVVHSLRGDIESGISISDGMRKYPEAFGELYVAMIKAGELGGILDVILERLSGFLEASQGLKGKIMGALTYPAVIMVIALGATVFLLTGVIPKFAETFAGMGAELPMPTKVVLWLSHALVRYMAVLIAAPIIAIIAFKQAVKRSYAFAYFVDNAKLNAPIFGPMMRKMSIAKFTQTLGTLVKSGVPILQALETVAKTSGNKVIEKAIMDSREAVREGEKVSDPLRKSGVFPPMVMQMISVGEETGTLDQMLNKIAEFYNREVDEAAKALTSMMEPLIMVFLGGIIGTIVLAMFMPIMEMSNAASKG
jgi:type IV pilus assembly protein PilC